MMSTDLGAITVRGRRFDKSLVQAACNLPPSQIAVKTLRFSFAHEDATSSGYHQVIHCIYTITCHLDRTPVDAPSRTGNLEKT